MSLPIVRDPKLDFTSLPRDWYDDNPTLTHAANALHLLFPEGERFFIRSVHAFSDRVQDPELKARVRAFAGQEAMHGRAHDAATKAVCAQGYEVEAFLEGYHAFITAFVEGRLPPRLRLSITAALEHLTASFAIVALSEGRIDHMAPPMDRMMRWHALEEIEHRDVAFDVYVAAGGKYPERALGMGLAMGGLVIAWARAASVLQRQDPRMTRARRREDRARFRARGWSYGFLGAAARTYLKPGFHPSQLDVSGLVADALVKLEMTAA